MTETVRAGNVVGSSDQQVHRAPELFLSKSIKKGEKETQNQE
jgi:hypothetical protein